MAKLLNKLSRDPINPLIGAAGVSAVPMAARVANKVGLEANRHMMSSVKKLRRKFPASLFCQWKPE